MLIHHYLLHIKELLHHLLMMLSVEATWTKGMTYEVYL